MNGESGILALHKWFIAVRIVTGILVGAGIILFRQFGVFEFDPRPILFALIPFYLLINIFWFWTAKNKILLKPLLHVQLIIDLLTITLGIHFSGGLHSEFIFFYLFVIISAAVISLQATMSAVATALVLYTAMLYMEASGIISPADITHYGFQGDEIEHLAVFMLLATGAAFQSYYYIKNTKEKDRLVAKFKDEFLFRVAHDLRSPATAIRWIADKYSQARQNFEAEEINKDAKLVGGASDEILRLLRDLSEIARGEGAEVRLTKEVVNLGETIKTVIRELEPAIYSHPAKISYSEISDLPPVSGDARALKEVFTNLIDNAIKYSRKNGEISIIHEIQNGLLKTSITDNGQGIKKEDLPKLFTPYFRANTDKAITGTGMGLYIVKKLVEKMDGKIIVESIFEKGTTVNVYFILATN